MPYCNTNAQHFQEALRSVEAQTYRDFRLTIVDDGSSVPLRDVPNARVIRHEENRGISAARNAGMRAADSEFLAFMDADDVLHPLYLETLVRLLQDNPEADVSMCAFVGPTPDPTPRGPAGEGGKTFYFASPLEDLDSGEHYKLLELMAVWRTLYRREFLDFEFDENARLFEDVLFTPKVYAKARAVVHTDDVLYGYRLSPDGLSQIVPTYQQLVDLEYMWKRSGEYSRRVRENIKLRMHFHVTERLRQHPEETEWQALADEVFVPDAEKYLVKKIPE